MLQLPRHVEHLHTRQAVARRLDDDRLTTQEGREERRARPVAEEEAETCQANIRDRVTARELVVSKFRDPRLALATLVVPFRC